MTLSVRLQCTIAAIAILSGASAWCQQQVIQTIGSGCPDGAGVVPTIGVDSPVAPGAAFNILAQGSPGGGTFVVVASLSQASPPIQAHPTLPGCLLHVQPPFLQFAFPAGPSSEIVIPAPPLPGGFDY